MNSRSWKGFVSLGAILLAALAAALLWPVREDLPAFGDEEFEQLILHLGEPPGYFDTDNLISNESSYQHVLPVLTELAEPGGAYIGVGPDQNYTYISQICPRYAFLIDIRRDNLLLHLFLKQLLESCESRQQFLATLLGRSSKELSPESGDISDVVRYFRQAPPDREHFEEAFEAAWTGMRQRYPRVVADTDYRAVRRMAEGFFEGGMDLKFKSHGRPPRSLYPTLGELLEETDRDGKRRCYLASDSGYDLIRGMHLTNRIVPVVGDLSGERALATIGEFLAQREIQISAMYVSNVEFYLLRQDRFREYMRNLRTLPISVDSLVIRSYFSHWGQVHPQRVPGYFVTSIAQSLPRFLKLDLETPYIDYDDVVFRDFIPSRPHSLAR